MARGIRFTKAEAELIRSALEWLRQGDDKPSKTAKAVLAKLDAAEAPVEADHDSPKALQDALLPAARGKVVPLEGGWPMAAGMAKNAKATAADAQLIGEWMGRQGWLTTPMTLLDVLKKWHMWLPKARATQPPPSLGPGLGTDGTGQGTATAGKPPARGRPAQGFR